MSVKCPLCHNTIESFIQKEIAHRSREVVYFQGRIRYFSWIDEKCVVPIFLCPECEKCITADEEEAEKLLKGE
jgi:hypothetical protein